MIASSSPTIVSLRNRGRKHLVSWFDHLVFPFQVIKIRNSSCFKFYNPLLPLLRKFLFVDFTPGVVVLDGGGERDLLIRKTVLKSSSK